MSKFDEMSRSLVELYQKLTVSGKRTAAVTRLRIELAGLDRQRRDHYATLGEQVVEMKRKGQISDAGLLVALDAEFDKISRVTRKIQDTSDEIRKLNLEAGGPEEVKPEEEAIKPEKTENLLDSFGVV